MFWVNSREGSKGAEGTEKEQLMSKSVYEGTVTYLGPGLPGGIKKQR